MNQQRLDKTYMNMATELSQLSYATRKKVGALVVQGTHIISEGYNGTPTGFDNNCEYVSGDSHLLTLPQVLHAESNAISKLAKSTQSSLGGTLYCTLSPCFDCAKLIIQSGLTRVVYKEEYNTSNNGIRLLRSAGIMVNKMERDEDDKS